MIKGTVRSFVAEKRYGFIFGEDGQSYFFHVNDVEVPSDLMVEAKVAFEPHPSRKGMAARKVRVEQAGLREPCEPDDLMVLDKDRTIRGWKIAAQASELSASAESPNGARTALKNLARNLTANALVDAEYFKTTGRSGNYRYTIHNYKGVPAILIPENSDDQRYSARIARFYDVTGEYADLVSSNATRDKRHLVITWSVSFVICVVFFSLGAIGFWPSVIVVLAAMGLRVRLEKKMSREIRDWLTRIGRTHAEPCLGTVPLPPLQGSSTNADSEESGRG